MFVFGTLPAVLMPIVVAVAAILNTFTLIWGLTYITNVSIIVQFLVALVGLGVAIDYALLMIFRFRDELREGENVETALVETMTHAGRDAERHGRRARRHRRGRPRLRARRLRQLPCQPSACSSAFSAALDAPERFVRHPERYRALKGRPAPGAARLTAGAERPGGEFSPPEGSAADSTAPSLSLSIACAVGAPADRLESLDLRARARKPPPPHGRTGMFTHRYVLHLHGPDRALVVRRSSFDRLSRGEVVEDG